MKDSVLVTIADGNLVLSPYPQPRESWDEIFKTMSESGDDPLLDMQDIDSPFAKQEWEW